MRRIIREFLVALSFLSRIPLRISADSLHEIREISKYFSLIGYTPGLIYFLGRDSENLIGYAISLAIGYWLFDLFHFDGLLDTVDGFLAPGSRERRLEIMSKSDVGAFAIFYGVLYLLIYWELFNRLAPIVLLYSSVFGRLSINFILHFSKPAKSEGLGRVLYPYERINTLISIIFTLPLIFNPLLLLIGIATSFITGFFMAYISEQKIGGYTGDVLGGSCLIGQIVFLGICYIV